MAPVQQVLSPVREDEILFVERFGFLLCRSLVRSYAALDVLLCGLRVVGGDKPLLVFLLELGYFVLEVLLLLCPALLCLFGLVFQGDAFCIVKIGLREHGFDLHVCDVTAAHFPLLGCFGSCRFDVFGAAGGKSCQGDQCREEEFFHVLSVVLVKNIALKGKGRKKSLLLSSHIQN